MIPSRHNQILKAWLDGAHARVHYENILKRRYGYTSEQLATMMAANQYGVERYRVSRSDVHAFGQLGHAVWRAKVAMLNRLFDRCGMGRPYHG